MGGFTIPFFGGIHDRGHARELQTAKVRQAILRLQNEAKVRWHVVQFRLWKNRGAPGEKRKNDGDFERNHWMMDGLSTNSSLACIHHESPLFPINE